MLAMHMANELLSLSVALVTLILAAGAVVLASRRAEHSLTAQRLPLMGVLGAFVFAAQMINFTLPLMPGTSGHLGGGVLLAIILGPSAGILTMACILIVQCLLFQDGGLLALGCNIINMGIVPCLAGWWLYRALLGSPGRASAWRQYLAAWAACVVAVTAGAALVPVEAGVSGVLRVPAADFLTVMVGVHLLIGLVEGLITFAVLAYLRRVRPAVLGLDVPDAAATLSPRPVIVTLLLTAALLACVASWFASTSPDGLEWSYSLHRYGKIDPTVQPGGPSAAVDEFQSKWTPLADYSLRQAPLGQAPAEKTHEAKPASEGWRADGWLSLAGLIGTGATLGMVYGTSLWLRRRRVPTVTAGR